MEPPTSPRSWAYDAVGRLSTLASWGATIRLGSTLLLLASVSILVGCLVNPQPSTSVFLRTTTGGFTYHKETHVWTMELFVKPLETLSGGGPLYLDAQFQNPRAGGKPLIVESSSLEKPHDPLGIKLETGPVTGMQDQKTYQVVVSVYADRARTKLLDTLHQGIKYHDIGNPEAVLQGLKSGHIRPTQ